MSVAIRFECDAEDCVEHFTVRPRVGAYSELEVSVHRDGDSDEFMVESTFLPMPPNWKYGAGFVLCPAHSS